MKPLLPPPNKQKGDPSLIEGTDGLGHLGAEELVLTQEGTSFIVYRRTKKPSQRNYFQNLSMRLGGVCPPLLLFKNPYLYQIWDGTSLQRCSEPILCRLE